MQLTYRTPGVYFEWLDAPAGLQPEATHIAGFVGIARRGPLHTPLRVESWTQFRSLFGDHTPQGYLAYAVEGFFANGGQACYVVRSADPAAAVCASLDILDANGWPALRLTASSPGVWANELRATVLLVADDRFNLTLALPGGEQELWRNLSLDPASERSALRVLNGIPPEADLARYPMLAGLGQGCQSIRSEGESAPSSSRLASFLVVASLPAGGPAAVQAALKLEAGLQTAYFAGGIDGLQTLGPEHISGRGAPPGHTWGLAALEPVDPVAIVAIPDLVPPQDPGPRRLPPRPPRCVPLPSGPGLPPPPPLAELETAPLFSAVEVDEIQQELVGHCERLHDRLAILASLPGDTSPEGAQRLRREFDTSYAALYFPWLRVTDPLELDGLLRTIPPVGHIAGVYARAELQIGVHKPPANELLEGVQDVTVQVGEVLHGILNDAHINVIRSYPGRGVRVYGARTLSSDSLWRYVNVRRLLIMIERSLETQTQWLVFESNNLDLWRDMDRILRNFLNRLWQRGMLEGTAADPAFTVVCNETTNPPSAADQGRVVAQIGVRPPWPAEFVVVRIGRTESGIQILDERQG